VGLWLKNEDGFVPVSGGGGGADGQPGVDGEDGQPGVDGNMWHVGSGAPDPTLGEPGDYYLDGTDGWVYVKRNDSSWTNLYVNLTGPPGSGGGGDFLPLTGGTLTGDGQTLTLMNATPTGQPHIGFYHNGVRKGYIGNANPLTTELSAEANELVLGGAGVRVGTDLQVDGQVRTPTTYNNGAPTYTFTGATGAGMWCYDNNLMGFTVSGVEFFRNEGGVSRFKGNLQADGSITAAGGTLTSTVTITQPHEALRLRAPVVGGYGAYMSVFHGDVRAGYFGYPSAPSGGETIVHGDSNTLALGSYVSVKVAAPSLQVDGQIKAQNGSAAAPAYSFTNETNTGIWYDAAGVEIVKEGIRVAKLLKTATFLPGVNATVMSSGYKANVMSMWNGQLVLIDGLNRSNIKETEAVSHAAINNVYDLQPVWFRSTSNTDNPEHSYYGLIADDCAAIDPRLATYRADKDGVEVADDVNTDAVVALLVSAVKSQRDTIADLTARIETLEGQTCPY